MDHPESESGGLPGPVKFALLALVVLAISIGLAVLVGGPGGEVQAYEGFN